MMHGGMNDVVSHGSENYRFCTVECNRLKIRLLSQHTDALRRRQGGVQRHRAFSASNENIPS